jgi:transcriptional regulator with XRE-family HTH domain
MRNEDWSAARIAAALAKLEGAGLSQPEMARMAGVSQSTVNRWSRGRVQPGYGAVRRLAVAAYRTRPDLARELVEASGYAWAEPQELPPEPVVPERLRREIMSEPKLTDEERQAVLRAVERQILIERGAWGQSAPPPADPGRERPAS